MTLLRVADVQLSFGSRTLFEGLTVTLEEGERVGLIGVNGSGKSTLMKILAGVSAPDRGQRQLRRGATVTYLPQEPEFPPGATVESELSVAEAPLRDALAAHADLADRVGDAAGDAQQKLLEQMSALSDRIEHLGGWDPSHRAKTLLDRLGVKDWERPVADLSGGLRKRVAIARALLTRPDLLLLDEPTNHLDAETVDWLEEELDQLPGGLLLVTHDRYFLDDLVDRIVEIEPGGGVTSYPGNYQAYVELKLQAQEEAATQQHKRERWISQEVAWLRRGPEARRTKSKSRIQRAQKLMAERGFTKPRAAEIQSVSAPRLGHTVIEARSVSKSFGERRVLSDVSLILQRGQRVGLVGPNGAGKTTLLRVLLGELAPDSGEVIIGKNTRPAYYDQQRTQLDPESTVYDAASGEDYVDLGGKRIALRDYLDDLLFPVPMQRMKVKALSGGERNRLLLARLFLESANVLVLDEPTNDLDIVTLNVLEGLLLGFGGAVLLVTHDRYFLDKVATNILAFEGNGRVVEYPGNFEMYRTLKAKGQSVPPPVNVPKEHRTSVPEIAPTKKAVKLSYKDQRELDGIESEIQRTESLKASLEAKLADPSTYMKSTSSVTEIQADLTRAAVEVDRLYARWSELSQRAGQSE